MRGAIIGHGRDTQRLVGALQLVGGALEVIYGGGYGLGGGGGYLIGSGVQNLSGDIHGSAAAGHRNQGFLADLQGSFTGTGPSTPGRYGGAAGALLGGTVAGEAGTAPSSQGGGLGSGDIFKTSSMQGLLGGGGGGGLGGLLGGGGGGGGGMLGGLGGLMGGGGQRAAAASSPPPPMLPTTETPPTIPGPTPYDDPRAQSSAPSSSTDPVLLAALLQGTRWKNMA